MSNNLNTTQFASGTLFVNPNSGTLATDPTPFRLGEMQDISIDFKGENVSLFSQNRFPDIIAQAEVNCSIKATYASLQGIILSQAFLVGATPTAGANVIVDQELHTVPASTPFTITVDPPGSGTWVQDLGVQWANPAGTGAKAPGRAFTKLPSGTPTTGQYTQTVTSSEGVYTFAAADAGSQVWISYVYNETTPGVTYSYQNQRMGLGPVCDVWVYLPFTNFLRGYEFPSCYCKSISQPTKQKGFTIQTIEFDVADTPGGNVFNYFDFS